VRARYVDRKLHDNVHKTFCGTKLIPCKPNKKGFVVITTR